MYEKVIYYSAKQSPKLEDIEKLIINYSSRFPEKIQIIKEYDRERSNSKIILKFFDCWNLYFHITTNQLIDVESYQSVSAKNYVPDVVNTRLKNVGLIVSIEGDEDSDMEYFQDFFYLFEHLLSPHSIVYDPILDQFDD